MTEHPTVDDFADAAAGLAPELRRAELLAHAESCSRCAEVVADLAANAALLESDPPPPMPDEVWARVQQVVAAEQQRLTSGRAEAEDRAAATERAKRTSVGSFGANPAVEKEVSAQRRRRLAAANRARRGDGSSASDRPS